MGLSSIGVYAQDRRWGEIEDLLRQNAEELTQHDRDTLLCEIAYYGAESCIALLLDLHAGANFRFDYGTRSLPAYKVQAYPRTTPIGQTILGRSYGRFQTLPTLKMLLDAKADPNIHTYQGYTPQQLAIVENCAEHAELLVSAGADPDIVCEDSLIPTGNARYFAEQFGDERPWTISLLSRK